MNITEENIGFHVKVEGDKLPNVNSLQMFLIPPQKLFDKTVKKRLPVYKETIETWKRENEKRKIFVHGSYTINLSNPKVWSLNALKNQLKLSDGIGADGVVIHCGKALKDKKKNAELRFLENVGKAYYRIGENCPLLIETCVGAGTEIFSQREEFEKMILGLQKKFGRKKIGCCIDTAHVWSAGYHPKQFLKELSPDGKGAIKLIHFNNSFREKGSKSDLHAPLMEGLIPPTELLQIANWAIKHNIPLVVE